MNRTRKWMFIALTAMLLGVSAIPIPGWDSAKEAKAAGTTYYVSTSGNDSWDGLAATYVSGSNGPFLTINKCAQVAVAGDTCIIKGGIYRETVTPVNSGTSGNPIVFRAATGETVTVKGTDAVTGTWSLHTGNIYKVDLTMSLGHENQVFVNDVMMDEARWPDVGGDVLRPQTNSVDSVTGTTRLNDSAITQSVNYWTGAKVWVTGGSEWFAQTSDITGSGNGYITFNALYQTGSFYDPKAGNDYFIFGTLNALSTANEWYYDSANTDLYLWAPGGSSPTNVEVKARRYAFDLSDLNYITIQDIDMFGASIDMSGSDYCLIDGINAKYISHSNLMNEGFASQTLWSANYKSGILLLDATNNTIKNSTISYSSGPTLLISGSDNKIVNNLIHSMSYYGTWHSGIVAGGTRTLISHNTAYDSGREVIVPLFIIAGEIKYNKLYNAGLLTSDNGVIYNGGLSDGQNTVIHHNWVYGNQGHLGNGIYLDSGSSNYIVHHNVIWDVVDQGIRLNVPSNHNHIYNNTVYTTNGTDHFGFTYTTDTYGTRIENNLYNGSVVMPAGTWTLYNETGVASTSFTDAANNDFHLMSTADAVDSGMVIAGITDGFAGSAPDKGAYEYNGTDWTPGHNFSTPPNPSYAAADTTYMNRTANAGFESGDFTNWTKTGASTASIYTNTDHYNANRDVRQGTYAVDLGTSANGLEQTITGLKANTTYTLSGWLLAKTSGQAVTLGVKSYGGLEATVTYDGTSWARREVSFTTGENNTSATIFISKAATSGKHFVDDIGLTEAGDALNMALPGTASSSGNWDSSLIPSKAFDGDISTAWAACNGCWNGSWLEIDFGSNKTFNQVTLSEYDNRVQGFRIEYWDGSAWSTAYTGTTIGNSQVRRTYTFTAVTGSKARIYFTSGNSYAPIIYEFEVYHNLALGQSYASSSNYDTTMTPAKAFDGDIGTAWAPCNNCWNGSWIEVDFGANETFSQLVFAEYDNRTTAYRIEYWDGSTWVTAAYGQSIGSSQMPKQIKFPGVTGSKARIYFLSGTTSAPIIYEWGLYP